MPEMLFWDTVYLLVNLFTLCVVLLYYQLIFLWPIAASDDFEATRRQLRSLSDQH